MSDGFLTLEEILIKPIVDAQELIQVSPHPESIERLLEFFSLESINVLLRLLNIKSNINSWDYLLSQAKEKNAEKGFKEYFNRYSLYFGDSFSSDFIENQMKFHIYQIPNSNIITDYSRYGDKSLCIQIPLLGVDTGYKKPKDMLKDYKEVWEKVVPDFYERIFKFPYETNRRKSFLITPTCMLRIPKNYLSK